MQSTEEDLMALGYRFNWLIIKSELGYYVKKSKQKGKRLVSIYLTKAGVWTETLYAAEFFKSRGLAEQHAKQYAGSQLTKV